MQPPDAPVCAHCERPGVRVYRRDLCRSCHRKLFDCDLPMPPDSRKRPVREWFVAWVLMLPAPVQQALFDALQQRSRGNDVT